MNIKSAMHSRGRVIDYIAQGDRLDARYTFLKRELRTAYSL